eukprot:TRINITY_DN2687_c0_g1_i5.p1 TRINITY_DN2687_c0_g1~~TRINITY_DN2687_c0_g1_i5.p1  ORF type:complete len:256 (+),score=46.33 TRINITY_DN2687_c0_g1_i5:49-816(+)
MYFFCCYVFFFFLMIRRPPRSTQGVSSAASDVYKRQGINAEYMGQREMKKCTIKVVIVGDASVGKTSLMQQYVQSIFSTQYKATIGAEFLSKEVIIDDKQVSMQIWDTAGQEKYQSVQRVFYRGADACIIVYDITNIQSFANIKRWKEEFLNAANVSNPEGFPLALIGNKSDLITERKIAYAKAAQWAKENGELPYFESSAKTAINVKEAFECIAQKAVARQESKMLIGGISTIKTTTRLTASSVPDQKKGCACQ